MKVTGVGLKPQKIDIITEIVLPIIPATSNKCILNRVSIKSPLICINVETSIFQPFYLIIKV